MSDIPKNKNNKVFGKIAKYFKTRVKKIKSDKQSSPNRSKDEERKLVEEQIRNYLEEFVELRVSNVMIPRPDIVAVPLEIEIDQLYEAFVEHSFTRIPVYNDTPDEIIGFIHVKDFLPYCISYTKQCYEIDGSYNKENLQEQQQFDKKKNFDVKKIIRSIIHIPRSTKCIDLLIKMRKEATHIAVIIDEYGGTEGLVMIELLIEKIVGDIRDEHDNERPEQSQIHKVTNNSYVIDARTSIEKIKNTIPNTEWLHNEGDEYETIGGFVLSYLGRMPNKGEIITDDKSFHIEVEEIDVRRIKAVRLTCI